MSECLQQDSEKRKAREYDLPQIAVKRRDSDCPSSTGAQVVLLNGTWDTSTPIPSIVAEMHNVNVEEFRLLQKRPRGVAQQQQQQQQILKTLITHQAQQSHHQQHEIDCTDGNLSWLLNYKLEELPPVPDSSLVDALTTEHNEPFNQTHEGSDIKIRESFNVDDFRSAEENISNNVENGKKQESGEDQGIIGNEYKFGGPKKPPFTYTELIEYALSEKGELTVSGIYQWISDHFPFYKQNDDRWKNSVRHNLSINPHFRKGGKAIHGAGHLWTIAQQEDKKAWNVKKQRMRQFMQMNSNEWSQDKQLEMELATATASILPENSEDHTRNGFVKTLNGYKHQQNIEVVEYINIVEGLEDFLCPPVTKEQVVQECGLGDDYLITDLNPQALGLNLAEAEIIANGSIYDDLNFQSYELQTE